MLTKTIESITRLRNTPSGNARHNVHFTDGTTIATAPDSAVNLIIGNREYNSGEPVRLVINGDFKITHVIASVVS